MPLVIDHDLPAKKILEKENIFIMDEKRAKSQDIRPIKLAIVNLMPNKEQTEIDLLRVLSNTPLQVNVDFIYTSSYKPKNTKESYLHKFYKSFESIKDEQYDGLIVTGAPVEHLEFESVKYWDELKEIFEFAKTNVFSTLFICWASQAALYYYYDIPKIPTKDKIFGIYSYELKSDNMLTKGFDDIFYMPQSRHSYTKEEDIKKVEDLKILGSDSETGTSLVISHDERFVFISGHSEYNKLTLFNEYMRDLEKGLEIKPPLNYFKDDLVENEIKVSWRSHANLLFSNWLNYYVYQETPFNIAQINPKL